MIFYNHLSQPFSELLPHQLLAQLHLVLLLAPEVDSGGQEKLINFPLAHLPGLVVEQNEGWQEEDGEGEDAEDDDDDLAFEDEDGLADEEEGDVALTDTPCRVAP